MAYSIHFPLFFRSERYSDLNLQLENQNEIYLAENISNPTNGFVLMTENQANLLFSQDLFYQIAGQINKV